MRKSELPAGWCLAPLGDLLREPLRNGHSAPTVKGDDGIPTLSLTAVTTGDFENNIKITSATAEKASDLWIEPGDIFIQRSNTPDLVGTTRLFRGKPRIAIFPDLLIRIRVHEDLPPEYVEAALQAPALRHYFRRSAKGIAGSMPKIGQDIIADAVIPLGPQAERRRIVETIDEHLTKLDAAVAGLERVQANLKRYRASVLKAAVEGRLVPTEAELARQEGREYEPASVLLQRILVERRRRWEEAELAKMKAKGKTPRDDSWKEKYPEPVAPDTERLPRLPEGWCWSTVDQLCDVGTGATPNRGSAAYWSKGTIPWITSAAVNDVEIRTAHEFVTEAALRETNLTVYPPGTIVIAMYGEGKTRGRPSMLRCSAATNQALAALRPFASDDDLARWTVAALAAQYERTRTLSSGGVQPNLNLSIVRGLSIALPPTHLLTWIVNEIDERISTADRASHDTQVALSRCTRLRQSILKWAFEGKLVDQDPNDEPASALLARIRAERESTPTARRSRTASPRARKATKKS